MRSFIILICSLGLISQAFQLFSQSDEAYFILDPAPSPDGSTIIFSYEGDLWKIPMQGGTATRLTAMDGEETRPNISPDGKWLAFSATQYGNKDVFLMPLDGGEIRQLTFHQAFDDVDSWSWDSKNIYFTSNRENRFSGYQLSIKGGTPSRLFDHYFNTVHNLAEHPSSGEIYFNESWESKNFVHRKRYKGDYNPDIKSYNRKTGTFTRYTNYRGKDFGATIDQSGKIYFASDEANGEYNLYTFDGGNKKQLTDFSSSVFWPKVSANGKKVVFRMDYQLYVFDVSMGLASKVPVTLYKNQTLEKDRDYKVQGNINDFDVSPDNKKMAFSSRGRLFVSDIKGQYVREVETDDSEAVDEVCWLKDNRSLLYSMSDKGYYNWFTVAVDGSSPAKQITDDKQNNRKLSLNSDRSQAVYLSGRNEVRLLNLDNMESRTIVEDELWAMYNPKPYFSPDDRWIVYTAIRDFERDIFAYDTKTESQVNLTHSKVAENQPFWSEDGKYLYFSTDRLQPSYPFGNRNTHIYRMAFDRYDSPYASSKWEELFEDDDEENNEKDKEKDKDKDKDGVKGKEVEKAEEKKKDSVAVEINIDGLMDRLQRISPGFGQQYLPYVIQKEEKTIVLYLSNHDEGDSYLWKTTIEPFKPNKTEKFSKEKMGGFSIRKAKDNYYLLAGGKMYELKIEGNKMEPIEFSHTFRKGLSSEFNQMFYEAWAGFEENFYDEDFHGQDWQSLAAKYGSFLPFVSSRSQLRLILNEMLGELNTSHFGFYSGGKEEETYHGSRSLATGIQFDNEDPYLVSRIVSHGPTDKKGMDIQAGDRLIEVGGISVVEANNRESYFTRPSLDKEISLVFRRDGEMMARKVHPTSYNAINNLLYNEWEKSNEAYVDSHTDKKVAYVHMKNMGRGEFNRFMEYMVGEGAYRDGLILDLRYNTGGNVHDDVLRFLSQRSYLHWKYREGARTTQSNMGPADKPIILLINEQSLSDAEMTAAGFKELGLGTIVGTETYRWIIFTSGKGLVDGSFYRLPSWGCYTLDGKNLEKEGVSPDIRVEKDFSDRLEGSHPQLDKAIELVMKALGD